MARKLPALLVAIGLGLSACGDDSDGGNGEKTSAESAAPAPKSAVIRRRSKLPAAAPAAPSGRSTARRRLGPPQQTEELSTALAAFKAAAAEGDCQKLLPLRHSAERTAEGLGTPPSQEECAAFTEQVLPMIRGANPVANEALGTVAAAVDYDQNGQQLHGLWLVEADGKWRFLANALYAVHGVGSKPEPATKFDEGVNGFVAAAQQRDCKEMFRFLDASSPYIRGSTVDQWCAAVEPAYDSPNNFFSSALKDKSAKPQALAKTRLNGVYGIELGGIYWIVVGQATPDGSTDADKHVPDGASAVYAAGYAPA